MLSRGLKSVTIAFETNDPSNINISLAAGEERDGVHEFALSKLPEETDQ